MPERMLKGQRGFTLMEIIIVLAVIGALMAVLGPVVFRYIEDGRRAQAQHDVNMIASAINNMYKDTGLWPFYATKPTGGGSSPGVSDAVFLTSNPFAAIAALSTDTTRPAGTTVANVWDDTKNADSLVNQLITNKPGYVTSTTNPKAWKGPYVDKIPATDPWSKSYLVNIGNADPAKDAPGTQAWTIVISAGPNGTIETNGGTVATTNPSASGDDIIARIK